MNRTQNPIEVTMDFVNRSNIEIGTGRLSDDGDPEIREVVQAVCGEPTLSKLSAVPSRTKREHATAGVGKQDVDEWVEPPEGSGRAPLAAGFGQRATTRATGVSAFLQARRPGTGKSERIAIKAKKRILFIDASDLIAVEAKGNYVLLLHTSGSHMLRESISAIQEKLNRHGFVRIHRSVIVNAGLVEEIHPRTTGDYVLRMRGGREFTVTRAYKKNLQLLAPLWIGIEGFAAK